jgi:hypothetical protein
MRVNIFMMSAFNDAQRAVLRAFKDGVLAYYSQELLGQPLNKQNYIQNERLLKKQDIWVDALYAEKFKECSMAVQFGSVKSREILHHIVKQDIKDKAENIMFLETPLIGRVVNNKDQHDYFRIGVNGFLNGEGHFNNENSPPDRWNRFKDMYGYKDFNGWKDHTKGAILLLVQLPGDASLRGQDMAEWVKETVFKIRSYTDREIIIRLHPAMGDKGRTAFMGEMSDLIFNNIKNITWSGGRAIPLLKDFERSGICISYSSGSAIDAVLNGVPCITADEGNFVWPIASRSIDDLNDPYLADKETVQQWLYDLSYCQWSTEEIKDGTAWKHFNGDRK